MSMSDYQKLVDDFVQARETPYWAPLSQLAQISEELGEIGRILNHRYGDKIKKNSESPDDLESEFGDIIFALICLANSEGIDLEKALERTLHKANTRDKDRFPKKAVQGSSG